MKEKLNERLGQILVPLVTPFKQNREVNFDLAGCLASRVIERNFCNFINLTGTTGEFNTLDFEERVELFKTVKASVAGRVPLVAGTGCASTRETIKLTMVTEELGFDCAMVAAPFYCPHAGGDLSAL